MPSASASLPLGLLAVTASGDREGAEAWARGVRARLAPLLGAAEEDIALGVARAACSPPAGGDGLGNVPAALEALAAQGVRDLRVATSLLVAGRAWELVRRELERAVPLFRRVSAAAPLLADAGGARALARCLDAAHPARAGAAVVLVGHGSPDAADLAYQALGNELHLLGRDDALVATLRGAVSRAEALSWLASRDDVEEVRLVPCMAGRGVHWERDVLGAGPAADRAGAWLPSLERMGYRVEADAAPLMPTAAFQDLVARRAAAAPAPDGLAPFAAPSRASLFGERGRAGHAPARFPIFVDLAGARCLVAGGGAVGARRARALAAHGARVTVIDPAGCQAAGEGARVVRRAYAAGDEEGFALVVAATSDRAVNGLVGARCRAAGIPVSVADAPVEGTFHFPALLEAPGLVGGLVSTDGDHARTARTASLLREAMRAAGGPYDEEGEAAPDGGAGSSPVEGSRA